MKSRFNSCKGSLLPMLAVVVAGCVASLPEPGRRDVALAAAKWPGTTLGQLKAGRGAYVKRCSGCHQLYLPASREPDAWPGIVGDMTAERGVPREEVVLIERYLVIASARERAARGPAD